MCYVAIIINRHKFNSRILNREHAERCNVPAILALIVVITLAAGKFHFLCINVILNTPDSPVVLLHISPLILLLYNCNVTFI